MISKYLKEKGINSEPILTQAGISPEVIANPNDRIPVKNFVKLLIAAQHHMQDNHFSLHIGEALYSYPGSNLLFSVMMNSPTVGVAFENFFRYHNLMNDAIQPKILFKDTYAFLTWDIRSSHFRASSHVSEALVCIFNMALRQLVEQDIKPYELHFRHPKPKDTREHQRIFQAPVLFNQARDGLVIDRRHLKQPVFLADSNLLEILEHHAMDRIHTIYLPDSWSEKVIRLIEKKLGFGKPAIESIARELALSTRSLQDKLKQEGTIFRKLLDMVRQELAIQYMQAPDISLCDIAFIMGYSEQSAFNHAFKRWTGKTPKQYLRDIK